MASITPAQMKYTRLGNSGLKVSRIILGCMSYGTPKYQDWVLDEEESIRHIKAAYDLGINTFDTANMYSHGLSEVVLGKAIKQHNLPRDEIVVMTKVFYTVNRDKEANGGFAIPASELDKLRYANQNGLSRKHIFESVKHSLDRLQLDYVDVLQCHRFDRDTPVAETMQALHDVVKAGYARYIGMSSCWAWQFYKMQSYAREHGLTQFISMQNLHNAIYREEEREMAPMLHDLGVGMIPWSPIARGFLARPADEITLRHKTDQFYDVRKDADPTKDAVSIEINKRIATIAQKRGISMAQVALAWTLSKSYISAPIVGTTNLEKMADLVGAIHVSLTDEEIKSIDEPYEPRSVVSHA